jgi:hypothetical protein
MERYALFGTVAQEREFNRPEDFKSQGTEDGAALIYETDDRDEARAIYEAGGFSRNGVWNAVTRVVDRAKGQPDQATSHAPRKTDYDQQ